MAPTAIWMTDEGLGGIAVHVANDGPDQLVARLRIALYRDRTVLVGEAEERLDVAAHDVVARDVETVIGHFVDASFAYRFGPPAQDLIVATLEAVDGDPARPLAQSILFPTGRSADAVSAEALGLTALVVDGGGTERVTVEIEATTLVRGIRLEADGFLPEAEAFAVEPGHARRVDLVRAVPGTPFRGVRLAAVNLEAPLDIERAHR
jgi:beta-mannosidase